MELDLHITNKCNLYCKHCIYESNDKEVPDMSLNTVDSIIPSIKTLEIGEVHLTGGEPLLHPDIYEIIDRLNGAGLSVRLQTNGYAVDEGTAKKLSERGVESVLVSLDGTETVHNKFRGNAGSYKLAVNAIEVFVKSGMAVRVNTVLHKNNISCIKPILESSKALGAEKHSFFYLSPGGRGRNIRDLILSLREWHCAVKEVREVSEALNMADKVKYQYLIADLKTEPSECRLIDRDNCLIMCNGDVYPCVFFVNSGFSLGNVNNENLFDIWRKGGKWDNYRTERKKKCGDLKCGGGCMGLTYLLNGNISGCDPRCDLEYGLVPGCIRSYNEAAEHI